MKTLNVMLILLIFSFGYTSCTKIGKNVTIKGRVINPVNNEPIAEKKVYLYRNNFKTIKRTNTNENGEFELSAGRFGPIWAEVSYGYKEFYSLGFDYEGKYYSALKVDKGEVMNVDYHMVPYGEYRIKINNINCQGVNDTIIINQTNQANSFLGIDWVLKGCSGYTTAWDKVPMGTIHTKYTVIRSGVSNTYEVDFEVQPNQQNEQVIDY